MNINDDLNPYLDDIYLALYPRNVLMVGNPNTAVLDYFFRKDTSIQVYGPQNIATIQTGQTFEVVFLDGSFLSLEENLQVECLQVISLCASHVVILIYSSDPIEVFNQIGQLGRLLATQDFYRDLEVQDLYSPLLLFRKQTNAFDAVARYEEALQLLNIENQRRTKLLVQYENLEAEHSLEHQNHINAITADYLELNQKVKTLLQLGQENQRRIQEIRAQNEALQQLNDQLDYSIQAFWTSCTGKLIKIVESLRQGIVPAGSKREQLYLKVFSGLRAVLNVFRRKAPVEQPLQQIPVDREAAENQLNQPQGKLCQIGPVESYPPVKAHQENVSVIVCVHNAFDDVKRCLESVKLFTKMPYEIVLVDDGSAPETAKLLDEFAQNNSVKLVRNESARGYTYAANQGIHASTGEFVVLLNSDTVVTDGWLDRMVACAQLSERVGVVGPLSNTASYQSIPEYQSNGDWADNPLPDNITIQDMGRMVAQNSARLYPEMPLLNGFCLLIRKKVFEDIGFFDEENFGAGYGEEDDFVLRARAAGWKLKLADDTYIFHAQSKSYSNEKRIKLSERAGKLLKSKHGLEIIHKSVDFMEHNRVLEGIRGQSKVLFEREAAIREGRSRFNGKRILFVLPIAHPGGGGNVVIYEANAMRQMGVEVSIF